MHISLFNVTQFFFSHKTFYNSHAFTIFFSNWCNVSFSSIWYWIRRFANNQINEHISGCLRLNFKPNVFSHCLSPREATGNITNEIFVVYGFLVVPYCPWCQFTVELLRFTHQFIIRLLHTRKSPTTFRAFKHLYKEWSDGSIMFTYFARLLDKISDRRKVCSIKLVLSAYNCGTISYTR